MPYNRSRRHLRRHLTHDFLLSVAMLALIACASAALVMAGLEAGDSPTAHERPRN